jgi:glutathione S-transferase
MALLHLVLVLALLEFFVFGAAVARARARYHVAAPATTGNEMFERYYRVQQNTLEQLTMFVPGLFLFGWYLSSYVAAALGVVFILGRALYFRGYVASPEARHWGFVLSLGPTLILLIGGGYGALRALLTQFR